MKKTKLVSTISALSLLTATTPIVATSCGTSDYNVVGLSQNKYQPNQYMVFELKNSKGNYPSLPVKWVAKTKNSDGEYVLNSNFIFDHDLTLPNGMAILFIDYRDVDEEDVPDQIDFCILASCGNYNAKPFYGTIKKFSHPYLVNWRENDPDSPYKLLPEELIQQEFKLFNKIKDDSGDVKYTFNNQVEWLSVEATGNLYNKIKIASNNGIGSIEWTDQPVSTLTDQWITLEAKIQDEGEDCYLYFEYWISQQDKQYILGPQTWYCVDGFETEKYLNTKFQFFYIDTTNSTTNPIDVNWEIDYESSGWTKDDLDFGTSCTKTSDSCVLEWKSKLPPVANSITLKATPTNPVLPQVSKSIRVFEDLKEPVLTPSESEFTMSNATGQDFSLILDKEVPVDLKWAVESVNGDDITLNDFWFDGNTLKCSKVVSNANVLVVASFIYVNMQTYWAWNSQDVIYVQFPLTINVTE